MIVNNWFERGYNEGLDLYETTEDFPSDQAMNEYFHGYAAGAAERREEPANIGFHDAPDFLM